jgi:hypothetical protein
VCYEKHNQTIRDYCFGCNNRIFNGGGGNSTLNGTWVNSAEGVKIVLNNGNITVSMDNVEAIRGTYSTSGNNMTMIYTQVSGAMFGENASMMGLSTSQWYTQQQFRTAIINAIAQMAGISLSEAEAIYEGDYAEGYGSMFGTSTGTYSLNGNTLTVTMEGETTVFTRQ